MIMGFTVFDPAVAPRNGAAFRAWHEEQTDWDDTDEGLKPTIANQVIQSWYADMVGEFPNLNAAEASSQPTDAAGGDYNFAQHLCYVGFHHNVADVA